jgi:hypothetical protein
MRLWVVWVWWVHVHGRQGLPRRQHPWPVRLPCWAQRCEMFATPPRGFDGKGFVAAGTPSGVPPWAHPMLRVGLARSGVEHPRGGLGGRLGDVPPQRARSLLATGRRGQPLGAACCIEGAVLWCHRALCAGCGGGGGRPFAAPHDTLASETLPIALGEARPYSGDPPVEPSGCCNQVVGGGGSFCRRCDSCWAPPECI